MKTEIISIKKIKNNPNNPRIIKDDKFQKLVKSIQDFPQMLEIRPIVVNEDMIVLGGNMRLKACIEAGLKEIPIIKISNLTENQQKEFIIKDNVGYGEWDWDALANTWDNEQLEEWGLDLKLFDNNINLEDYFEESQNENVESKTKIVLEYTEEESIIVKEMLLKHGSSYEDAVWKLLKL